MRALAGKRDALRGCRKTRLIDPVSGYPVEGWNHEPTAAFACGRFTQLTAIGEWIEVLANVVAGYADTPVSPGNRPWPG